ncbi:MAG: histidinol-phosphate transaminase [Gammaproteobacteria bacterium]|nr:MAG: histidinol-phosphate transaminase [Gammaproteobacteria bacterium]
MKTPTEYIKNLVRKEIRDLTAYHVADPGDMIKLDAMENPYNLPEEILHEFSQRLQQAAINRYPDPNATKLKQRITESMSLPQDLGLILGNGSDELILMLIMALAGTDRPVLSVSPSFVMYKISSTSVGMPYVDVPLADDFSLDMGGMLAAIEQHDPALIFLAHPNNPTGNRFAQSDIEKIIETVNGLVVIDEAYQPFSDFSFTNQIEKYPNAVLISTVSKMGLAGLRLGLLIGQPEWVNELEKVRLPYNINILTQVVAEFALEHKVLFDKQTQTICADRELMFKQLEQIEWITPYPSQANFILFRLENGNADEVFQSLKEQGVLIKNLNPAGGLLANCLRVTIGTQQENQAFLEALKKAPK